MFQSLELIMFGFCILTCKIRQVTSMNLEEEEQDMKPAEIRPQAVPVLALAGDTSFCSWAGHLTHTVLPSTQVYE